VPAVSFFIPGRPVPKQSARFGRKGSWQPKRVTQYAKLVRWIVEGVVRRTGWVVPDERTPISVRIFVGYPHPKNVTKAHQGSLKLRVITPDVDNAVKSLLDSCCALWKDDRQVAKLEVIKLTVPRGTEGATIHVETIDDDRRVDIEAEYNAASRRAGRED
jgi:Holliday junction resolvase RusA-like endonuclease